MKDIVKVFYDVETTGTDPRKHSIHQIAGIIEVNDQIVEKFNILSRPHPKAQIDQGALLVCNKTEEDLRSYPSMEESHGKFRTLMEKYVDPFDKKDKIWMVGYNNRAFDDVFLHHWFTQNQDQFIGGLFWTDTIDVICLASQYLIHRRREMPSFKQSRVAKELGIMIDEARLHDASYDVELTREIYRIVTGLEIEI